VTPFLARWDLDKTYLRTEFDTFRDLLRTAFERADQKRTIPGASSLLRELAAVGGRVHILSGSPRQLRRRIEEKLRLDGATFETLTLKPNLENFFRLRIRALRDQVGFKLPALLKSRATLPELRDASSHLLHEILVGDDAESDAFIYCLYADICAGRIDDNQLTEILRRGKTYPAVAVDAIRYARQIEKANFVDRIFIHLERQSPPSTFAPYRARVIPFYNYLQPTFVLAEDGRISPSAVVRVAVELVLHHRFDAEALARSYLDLRRRGHVAGTLVPALRNAVAELAAEAKLPAAHEILHMCDRLDERLPTLVPVPPPPLSEDIPDYLTLVTMHNRRRRPTLL